MSYERIDVIDTVITTDTPHEEKEFTAMLDPVTSPGRKPVEQMTLEELEAEEKTLKARLRIIATDSRHPDPLRVEKEYRRRHNELTSRLDRLVHKRSNGEQLIEMYKHQLEQLVNEYGLLENREGLLKCLKAYHRANAIKAELGDDIDNLPEADDIDMDTSIAAPDGILEKLMQSDDRVRERMIDIRYLAQAYKYEILETRRAMGGAFEQQEAKLVDAIDFNHRVFDVFMKTRVHGNCFKIDVLERLEHVRSMLKDRRRGGAADEYMEAMEEISQLLKELTPDQLRYALRN